MASKSQRKILEWSVVHTKVPRGRSAKLFAGVGSSVHLRSLPALALQARSAERGHHEARRDRPTHLRPWATRSFPSREQRLSSAPRHNISCTFCRIRRGMDRCGRCWIVWELAPERSLRPVGHRAI